MNRLLLVAGVACIALCPARSADAQSAAMDQLYGQGVHAYHAGLLQEAMDAFSEAAQLGSRDPRVYYFRGLTHAGLGDAAAMADDFQTGARLEAAVTGRHYGVGRALERIQGGLRIQIEQARRQARLARRGQRAFPSLSTAGSVGPNRPRIPDPAERRSAAHTNFPDVSGIRNPGTPFTQQPAGNAATDASAKPPMPEADPFGDLQKKKNQQAPPVENDPFTSGKPQSEKDSGSNDTSTR